MSDREMIEETKKDVPDQMEPVIPEIPAEKSGKEPEVEAAESASTEPEVEAAEAASTEPETKAADADGAEPEAPKSLPILLHRRRSASPESALIFYLPAPGSV